MATQLNPYLNFRDNARSAIEFYQSVFGGELTLNTFADFQATEDLADQDKIMHSMLVSPNGLVLMASDTPGYMEHTAPAGFSVSLSGTDHDELSGYWAKLSDGATIGMPLAQAPWGDRFGHLVDKFGIGWMVNITATPAD